MVQPPGPATPEPEPARLANSLREIKGSWMADLQGDKQRITVALAASRTELRTLSLLVRRNLDIRRYLLESREKHLWGWMSAAAMVGWIFSRLPARKQKIYIQSSDSKEAKTKRGGGGLLKPVWDGMWSITKPLLAAYLTKKVAEKVKLQGAYSVSEVIRWAAVFLKGIRIL
jgi:hypothetical protein